MTGFHSQHPDNETDNFISPGDTRVIISDGVLLAGILCKKTVGSSAGGVIHVIMHEHGPDVCKWFFNGTQRVVNNWLIFNGFSIGIGDTIADDRTMNEINGILKKAKEDVVKIIAKAHSDALELQPGMTIRESFEAAVLKELNRSFCYNIDVGIILGKVQRNLSRNKIMLNKWSFPAQRFLYQRISNDCLCRSTKR